MQHVCVGERTVSTKACNVYAASFPALCRCSSLTSMPRTRSNLESPTLSFFDPTSDCVSSLRTMFGMAVHLKPKENRNFVSFFRPWPITTTLVATPFVSVTAGPSKMRFKTGTASFLSMNVLVPKAKVSGLPLMYFLLTRWAYSLILK